MAERPRLGVPRPAADSEPDVAEPYKRAVEAAIRWAWTEVQARWPEVVANGREESITECLCRMLNEQVDDRRLAPGLDIFETVSRGSKVKTADGRIEKAPDLVLRPIVAPGVRNRGDWGVFIECKIISPKSHHSPAEYCAQGVARFATGEYASRMPSAAMVAYVRDGRRPHPTLSPLLTSTYATVLHVATSDNVSTSQHSRHTLPQPCVNIVLSHWWLNAA